MPESDEVGTAGLADAQGAERNRIPCRRNRRNAVLELTSCGPGYQVAGARSEFDFMARPPGRVGRADRGRREVWTELHTAGGTQGQPGHDVAEHRSIPVPPNRGSGGILGHQRLDKQLSLDVEPMPRSGLAPLAGTRAAADRAHCAANNSRMSSRNALCGAWRRRRAFQPGQTAAPRCNREARVLPPAVMKSSRYSKPSGTAGANRREE